MGAAAAAAVVLLGVVAAAMAVAATTVATTTTRSPTGMPLYMAKAPKLDRAHKNKLLVEAPCTQYCKNVVWQYKEVGDSTWKWADAEAHSSFPDTFYLRRLRPDTLYVLRALLKPNFGPAYAGDEIPTLEARTCPEQPPPVENLRAHSAGPGWLEVRWTPPAKEACKSHLYYQARYSLQGQVTLGAWRQFGFFRSDRWVHFRPTHPCAAWPDEFCALFTDFVKAGEQHVVEVRVSRFDELTPALSSSRRLVVRADTACIVTNSCGVIGAAPPSNASVLRDATDDVDLDDSDLTTTPATLPAVATTKAPGAQGDAEGDAEGSAAARRAGGDASPAGDSAFGRLAPLFLALALLALAAVPAAFFWGKRRGTSEAVALHMVPGWRRRLGDGGSQPVLAEDGVDESDDRAIQPMPSASLEVDQHGRFSWAKLPQDN